ncbi:MAG: family 78 glycoside hydrolase catalytic domain [Saprospiraceae bacterium]|nr:family 78 glycoside hydrolase catalytic domain [Saprospiraceae bacterium]
MKVQIALLLLLCMACQSDQRDAKRVDFFRPQKAQWITYGRDLPSEDSSFYLDHPAPLFRKTFNTIDPPVEARLMITAAGYYLATINGGQVGERVLDPAWTDYSKRIYYSEYDVTALLTAGDNCVGVSLGNGFYNPLPLRKWGQRNLREDLTVGKPTFLAKLILRYENGKTEEVISDHSWTYSYSPIVKNSVYLGVVYDARREIPDWNRPTFDDASWKQAVITQGPTGTLQKSFFPPVQITEEITPVDIYSPMQGVFMVDMGMNFTGTSAVKIQGNTGDSITFRMGERMYEDGTLNPMTSVIGQIKRKGMGGPGAPDIAWQTNTYIVGRDTSTWFKPDFTYHTYRYMEIRGMQTQPQISDVKGLFFHSNLHQPNHFSCSSDLLNTIQEATERTFRANLISVQSDCPAREKFGYGGDINATSESFIYNFDMKSFYRKTIYDWLDAMNDTAFVDTAPFVGIQYCGISWESAFLLTQYYLYLYYNDTEIVKELYEADIQWMDKVARLHPEGLVEEGLSDHESLEPVPVQLTGTCHYLQCARIMSTFAHVMGDKENKKKYAALASELRHLVKATFWDQSVEGEINRQTLFSTLLYHDIIPDDELSAAKDSLRMAISNGPTGHFNTGIFGTKYALETASKYISPQFVFNIVNSTEYPGWGHMIDRGATTIWETWKESDDVYSNCHPMFGTVTEWYYRWLGGIRPDPENPGFKSFFLTPFVPQGLEHAECTYDSPHGTITSNWKTQDQGRQYEMSVPEGTMAKVTLQKSPSDEITVRKNGVDLDAEQINNLHSRQFDLTGGRYLINITTTKD